MCLRHLLALLQPVFLALVVAFFSTPLVSCGYPQQALLDGATAADQAEVLRAQGLRVRKVQITVVAPVYKILADDTEGLPHQRFLILLRNGTTVLIAHDTRMAPRVPIRAGDTVKIHGEYIWNPKGGVIHWTHHSDTPAHEGGWIDFNGQRYQ